MAVEVLHRSGYSSVFLGRPTADAPLSCYKVYEKRTLQARHWLNISRECCILSRLQNARAHGIVQLISVADTAQHFSLQFKPCLGGNLYQSIARQECQDEARLCAKVIIPLLRVLADLHDLGIIHRDIKPENIFFEADGQLVLGDFGLAIDSNHDKPCSRVGTLDYMAPEVMAQPSADVVAVRNIPRSMLKPYTNAVDIWALGILVHEALTGVAPFKHAEPAVMALKVQFGGASKLPGCVSAECQSFVDAVLQKQPEKRPSATALLQHPWVQKHNAQAAPAPTPVRYTCSPDWRLGGVADMNLIGAEPTNGYDCCFPIPASCKAAPTTQLPAGSPPATAVVVVKTTPKPKVYNMTATAAGAGCTVTYGFNCQQVQQQKPGTSAAPHTARPAAVSAFELNSRSSNVSTDAQSVTKLLLVPAFSAPMLLHAQIITAPAGHTPPSGEGSASNSADINRANAVTHINWRMSAVPANATVPAVEVPALRGSSWSPGKPVQGMGAAAVPSASSAIRGAVGATPGTAHDDAAVVAAAGAMEAPRVPAADACAVAAAAAAGASAASGALPTLKQLLSPSRPPLVLAQRQRSFPAGGRRCSVEVLLHSACVAPTSTQAATAVASALSSSYTERNLGLMGFKTTHPLNKGGVLAADALARSASAAPANAQQPVQVPPSPSKACRVMKGVCKKMLHALRHTQPGQAF